MEGKRRPMGGADVGVAVREGRLLRLRLRLRRLQKGRRARH